jgi:hypothetical protein
MKIAFIGPDMTGKSNIAAELSKRLGIPVFKNSGEWKTTLDSPDYFLNLLRYGGPFLMDFMKQTDSRVILDRFYPCELVYAQAFDRDTDMKAIHWMDEQFSNEGGMFILCLKKDYSGLVDDVFPDSLPKEKLEQIDILYRKFAKWSQCEVLTLYTDDHDVERQTSDIIDFLGV